MQASSLRMESGMTYLECRLEACPTRSMGAVWLKPRVWGVWPSDAVFRLILSDAWIGGMGKTPMLRGPGKHLCRESDV